MNKKEIEERIEYEQEFHKKLDAIKGDPEEKYKFLDLISEYEPPDAPKEPIELTFYADRIEVLCEDGEVYTIKASVGVGEYERPMPYNDFAAIFPSPNMRDDE